MPVRRGIRESRVLGNTRGIKKIKDILELFSKSSGFKKKPC